MNKSTYVPATLSDEEILQSMAQYLEGERLKDEQHLTNTLKAMTLGYVSKQLVLGLCEYYGLDKPEAEAVAMEILNASTTQFFEDAKRFIKNMQEGEAPWDKKDEPDDENIS